MRPRLVDPKYLISNKKIKKSMRTKETFIIDVRWILLFIFLCFSLYYFYNFVKHGDHKPDFSFLPKNIRNNEVFSKYKQTKHKSTKHKPSEFNNDELLINYEHIIYQ